MTLEFDKFQFVQQSSISIILPDFRPCVKRNPS